MNPKWYQLLEIQFQILVPILRRNLWKVNKPRIYPVPQECVVSVEKVVTLWTNVSRNMAFPPISKQVKDLLKNYVSSDAIDEEDQLTEITLSAPDFNLTKEQY